MCPTVFVGPEGDGGKGVGAREINSKLDEIRATALAIYTELSAIRENVTAEEVKHQLLGMASGQETLLSPCFRSEITVERIRFGIGP